MATAYATTTEYAAYIGAAGPANLSLLLVRASRNVDSVLMTSLYSLTDPTGAGRTVADELRDATIEQVSYLLEIGYENGLPANVQSVTIGSVQIGRGYSGAGGDANHLPFSPVAFQILQNAGLTGHAPQTETGPPATLILVD